VASGGDTLHAFKNGFIQALVLGPLIGLSQAAALRDDTTRWKWWFAANVTTWLFGAAAYELGKWLLDVWSLPTTVTLDWPVSAFLIHGMWMLGHGTRSDRSSSHNTRTQKTARERRPTKLGIELPDNLPRSAHCGCVAC
jgi:hypothetical protein